MLNCRFHPEALEELAESADYYEGKGEGLGSDFIAEIEHGIEYICERPEAWPPLVGGVRRFLVRRFPFAIVYSLVDETINIWAVMHLHRKPGYWKGRRKT
jgi:plasmid stabilization system protein ParE